MLVGPGISLVEALEEVIRFDIAADLDDILAGLGVSESLWDGIDPATFFTVVLAVAPQVASVTHSFLQLTK